MKTPPHLTRSEFNEILTRLTTGLSEFLGEQLADVYLYGSYARGDAYDGSDIDILIVIDGEFDYFELMDKTSDLSWGLSLENDIVISRVFVSKTEFNDRNSPFLMNVHQEAIPV
jgi:predicted nucleotidyltransferase